MIPTQQFYIIKFAMQILQPFVSIVVFVGITYVGIQLFTIHMLSYICLPTISVSTPKCLQR